MRPSAVQRENSALQGIARSPNATCGSSIRKRLAETFPLDLGAGQQNHARAHASTMLQRHPRIAANRVWCGRKDLNLHEFPHQNLNLARLPIPPRPHVSDVLLRTGVSQQHDMIPNHKRVSQENIRTSKRPRPKAFATATPPQHTAACTRRPARNIQRPRLRLRAPTAANARPSTNPSRSRASIPPPRPDRSARKRLRSRRCGHRR